MAANVYGIYLNIQNTTIRIPVNPEEIRTNVPSNTTKYNVLGLGQIIQQHEGDLRVFSWTAWFPANPLPDYVLTSGGFQYPAFYINYFDNAVQNETVLRLIINRQFPDGSLTFDTNVEVIVTSFEHWETGGSGGDVEYSITLTEYRNYEATTISIQRNTATTNITAVTATQEPQRTVPNSVIIVGDIVTANGNYYADSYGGGSSGNARGQQYTVDRIISPPKSGQNYSYHLRNQNGAVGWIKGEQLQKVNQ